MPYQICKSEYCRTQVFVPDSGRVDATWGLCDVHADEYRKLTGEVQDDSIPNGFKKLRSALRERARIYNKFIRDHHRPLTAYTPGIYRKQLVPTWGKALEVADRYVRDVVKNLERLTNA